MLSYRRLLNNHYGMLAEIEWRQGHASESVRFTLLRQKLWPSEAEELFRAGSELSRAASLLGKDPKNLPPEQKKEQDRYLDLALSALKQAVSAGYRDAGKMKTDPDLELMQSRAGFRALVADLERKSPDC